MLIFTLLIATPPPCIIFFASPFDGKTDVCAANKINNINTLLQVRLN